MKRALTAISTFALLATAACAKPGTHVSSEVVWARVDAQEFPVTPGDIVRIETAGPIQVTSVIGAAEVTQTLTPNDGVAMFRPVLGTTAVKVAGGSAVVHDGGPRDPEVAWFDLEDEAVVWSKSPLGTRFPALTPAPRIDKAAFAELDAALQEAHVGDAHAIRSLFALRAIRMLEGARIYPYVANGDETLPGAKREMKGRDFYPLKPGVDATVTLDGPTMLSVSSRVVRGATDVLAEVQVKEGARVRGSMRSVVHHLTPDGEAQKIGTEEEDKPDPTLSALRRVLVDVPPGKHTYSLAVSGAPTWVAATDMDPYEQLVDWFRGWKNESTLAEEARKECNSCAIALALSGKDLDAGYDAALAAAGPLARKEALALSAGAPFDRASILESDAASRDRDAIAQAGKDASASIDASLREAWARGTLRGTSWQTVDGNAPLTWFAAGAGSKELDANLAELTPEPWRRVQAIRLLATGPCNGEPVQLEVNGATLTAQPSSARAMWHIIVPPGPAKVRRVDKSPSTKVFILDQGGGSLIGAALPLPRTLAYPADATAPGVEVWLKAGASSETVTLTSVDGAQKLDVVVHAGNNGFGALAEDGAKWTRSATIPLPWPGAKATGGPNVAVRAVVRGVKSDAAIAKLATTEHAAAPDEAAVVAASRKLLAAKTPSDRAAAALERGKLLASYGAERAALDDAELAQSFGAQDASTQIQRAYRSPPPKPLELAEKAYGIEPDFDPNAARCAAGDGPRAKITALDTQLRARPKAGFDRSLAVQAATLKATTPDDPRGDTLVTLASNGSRWKQLRDIDGGGGRVARPDERGRNPLLDGDGRLRPHLVGGDPFGKNYVSVAADRPAKASVADLGGGKAHLDIVCTPRKAPVANETCALEVSVGDIKVPVTLDADGKATVDLPRAKGRGKNADLNVVLAPSKADYSALIRIVVDKEIPNTTKLDTGGFVLDTPRIQYRFLLPPSKPIRVKASQIGLLRVDAQPEGTDKPEIVALIGGKEFPIPANGDPKVLPVSAPNAPITITAKNGTATVAIAERVEADRKLPEGNNPEPAALTTRAVDATSARMSINDGTWRDTAEKSPKPHGWFLDSLGTFESDTGASIATLRDGATADKQLDAYGFEDISYRRRIESINLFTEVDGLVRFRDGKPTYGGSGTLYEDWNAARLRITGTVDVFAQSVNNDTATTIKPRGFIEYSARITPSVYILPRIGYDGYFTSIKTGVKSLKDVDDDVFNALRFARPNYAFIQALFWWVPFFDDIIYLRTRGTFDVGNGVFSHADLRPGLLFMAGPLEFNGYADAQYFRATPGARTSSGIDITGGVALLYHAPITAGSFEVRPTVQGLVRDDGGYQVVGGLTLLASAHRGVRDYSSLELSFPESTAGGVPWRTEGREGP